MSFRWRIDPRTVPDLRLAVGLSLPATAGLLVFGWRVVGVWGMIVAGCWFGRLILRRLHTWSDLPHRSKAIADTLLLSLFFPATLFDFNLINLNATAQWPAVGGIGILLAIFEWASLRLRVIRFHPVVLTVAVVACLQPMLFHTDRVLNRKFLLGDVLDDRAEHLTVASVVPWLWSDVQTKSRAFIVTPADGAMQAYLHPLKSEAGAPAPLARFVCDELPPLEDLVIGGHPRLIGCASAIALLSGALFLVYRGYVSWRMPTLMLIGAYASVLLWPIHWVQSANEPARFSALILDTRAGTAMAITFANYVLASSTLLLTGFFIATHPDYRPKCSIRLCFFALLYGALTGAATMAVSINLGAIFALLLLQFVWPLLGGLRRGNA